MKKRLLFLILLVVSIFCNTKVLAYDKYDGDYTLEYLLRNYNVVTFGTKDRYGFSTLSNIDTTKGSVSNVFDIGGPVLIRGNYIGNSSLENEYAQKTNGIPSYIKGTIGANIRPGSVELADISDIYVGSSNKVVNNNGIYTINSTQNKYKYPVKVSDDYLNFDKLYASIVNEQSNIQEGTGLVLNDPTLTVKYRGYINAVSNYLIIDSPGIYNISTDNVDNIYIFEYDPNELYIINNDSNYIYSLPEIMVRFKDKSQYTTDEDVVYCGRKNSDETCSGNIIWNFKNARYVKTDYSTVGHIIAPKADVELFESHYAGAIIANSISAERSKKTAIQFYPYNLDKKFTTKSGSSIITEEVDTNDDTYDGNYSIDELLRNYSVVSLGQKEYGSNTKLSKTSSHRGTTNIFHMAGNFLINGDLGVEGVEYKSRNNTEFSGTKLEFRYTDKNYATSYLKEDLKSHAHFTRGYTYAGFDLGDFSYLSAVKFYAGNRNKEISRSYSSYDIAHNIIKGHNLRSSSTSNYYYGRYINNGDKYIALQTKDYDIFANSDDYINFNRLYNSVVEQQKKIIKGNKLVKDSNGNITVPIGGNYVIDNINDVNLINFSNWDDNKNKLTVITINDTGSINFPKIGSANGVYTNDWYGRWDTRTYNGNYLIKNYSNEYLSQDIYFGNIVWNLPNATYIQLAEKRPFFGHVIAPNADVETPELHFAGAMIVNSLYSEGYSEAHFYPLTVGSVGTGIKAVTTTIGTNEVDKIDISGTKIWNDNNNQDGVRPESVNVNLLADGIKVASVTVSAKTNWTYTFKDMPRTKDGVKIIYTITEDAVENYSTEIDGYNITNSYTPKKTSLTVNKIWDDKNNNDRVRPEEVEVELYANEEKISSAKLTEENNWTYIFNDLDMYESGKRIEYSVKEATRIEGYTTKIDGDQNGGYNITNSYTTKKTSVTVNKVWKDDNNKYQTRPDSVEVELYANGEKIDSITLNAKNNWKYTFENLAVYESGTEIKYTIKELSKVKGYSTVISGNQEEGYTITNTREVSEELTSNEPEDKQEEDNPLTLDRIKKFTTISIISSTLLVACIIIFTKCRRKKA